jgi:hypothetical protein
MERALLALLLGVPLGASQAQAGDAALDVEAECRSISEADLPGCGCQGRYFESKFGPDQGAAALHLVGRSYASTPRGAVTGLYDRFGAAKLNEVAQRIMATSGEVAFYCPLSPDLAD